MQNLTNQFACGDAIDMLRGLPSKSVDLVLTDPPYIISRNSGMQALKTSGKTDETYGTKYAIQTDYGYIFCQSRCAHKLFLKHYLIVNLI